MKKIRTATLAARCDIVMTKAQMKVDEWYASVEVTEEQFNRMVESYSTGMFKQMNEDENLADLCDMYQEAGRTSHKQTLLVDYPKSVQDGKPFDELCKASKKKGMTEKERKEWVERYLAEHDETENLRKIWDRRDGSPEEEDVRYETLLKLQEWMTERGLDAGEIDCNLEDERGLCLEAVDIGWPHGLYGRRGYTKPVAVQFYRTTPELLSMAKERGYEVFESIGDFKAFIEKYCK